MIQSNVLFQVSFSLFSAIAVLVFLVLRTKIHAVLSLIIAASIAGAIGGMLPADIIASITKGFGTTLSSIGLVIGFGVMMGRILEVSGAAERMAYTLVRWLGRKREDWALALAGYIISIPIFCDSAFVVLTPLTKALARTTGHSILTLGICLAGGLVLAHHGIPPTPGPLGVAGIYNVDIGQMILWGILLTLPGLIMCVTYARLMGPKIEAMIGRDTGEDISAAFRDFEGASLKREEELPSLGISITPIMAPIALIFLNTLVSLLVSALENPDLEHAWPVQIITFLGHPVIAVAIGVLLAIYTLTSHRSRSEVVGDLEKGVESAGIILLVTGAGGALGAVLRDSGAGTLIGQVVASLPIPAILIPFIIASLVRLIQGSGTVAMITAASISGPILMTIPNVSMVFAAQAATLGSLVCGHFNDSYFWVVNRMLGVKSAKHQLLVWSVPTTLFWLVSLVALLICNSLFG